MAQATNIQHGHVKSAEYRKTTHLQVTELRRVRHRAVQDVHDLEEIHKLLEVRPFVVDRVRQHRRHHHQRYNCESCAHKHQRTRDIPEMRQTSEESFTSLTRPFVREFTKIRKSDILVFLFTSKLQQINTNREHKQYTRYAPNASRAVGQPNPSHFRHSLPHSCWSVRAQEEHRGPARPVEHTAEEDALQLPWSTRTKMNCA